MASLAAVFAALQCPTADVRCITFGSQLVGNAAFANAFRSVLLDATHRLQTNLNHKVFPPAASACRSITDCREFVTYGG